MASLKTYVDGLERARDAINELIPQEMKRLAGEPCAMENHNDGTWYYCLPCRENSVICKISWSMLPGRYEAVFYNALEGTLGDDITNAASLRNIVGYIRKMNPDGTVPPPFAGKRTHRE